MNHPEVALLYNKLNSYTKVGLRLGISKQRVHQIIKGYKNYGRKNRQKLYDKIWKDTCENCSVNNSTALHHIDGDNYNDNESNLQSVCTQCHYLLHKVLHKPIVKKCIICRKNIHYLMNKAGLKSVCQACYKYSKRGKNKRIRHVFKNKFCINCKNQFSKTNYYYSRNRCLKCYRHLCNNTEHRREWRKQYYIKKNIII